MFWKKPTRIKIIHREVTALRLEEWRAHSELVQIADNLWKSDDFRLLIQVLQNESPSNIAILSGGLDDRALAQARTEGYNLAIAKLRAMRVPLGKTEAVETTYEPEESND